ncbi:MAG TPA: chemotaxis protein CheA [bacterium]|nr:chemotaxis protein CheA [bacterium]
MFLAEAREYLSTLNNALVTLEREPSNTEAVHEIFRAAHTLKGMSATMGYEPMANLTHQMETVMEPIRSGAKGLYPGLVDALFICLDQLEKWVQILSSKDSLEEGDLAATLATLQEASKTLRNVSGEAPAGETPLSRKESLAFSSSEKEVVAQARMNGFSVFKITVTLEDQCVFKAVRAFMILKELNGLGEIVKSHPEPAEIEKGRFERSLILIVVTDMPAERIQTALAGIGEVQTVNIQDFREEEETAADESGVENGEQGPAPDRPGSVPLASGVDKAAIHEEKPFILPTVRVHTTKLDKLMALVQELVISKIRFEQVAISKSVTELSDPLSQLNHITDELQDEIMKVRLMPVKQIFERFPRMVRDLAKTLDKRVNLEMEGAEVELDRTIIEEMSEPLVHLLRNAIDHGIEVPDIRVREGKDPYGTIRLQAKRERSYVVISVVDDGRGIDPDLVRQKAVRKGLATPEDVARLTDDEVVRLITLPGFSTVENATEISGRGVGVDVAKTKVEALGGSFRIQSRKGLGTTFILRFPLTLAIIKALLVKSCGETFAIPVVNITETVEINPGDKKLIQQQETFVLREEVIPLYHLSELLELDPALSVPSGEDFESVLITEVGDSHVGLLVDEVIGQQEIAIKSLDKLLKGIRGFSGATILGSGKIALILDVNGLVEDLKDRRFQAEHSLLEKDGKHADARS